MTQSPLRLAAVLASGALAACSSNTHTVPATFDSPAGLVVAGPEHDLLFIANTAEDALQVGQLTSTLDEFDLVRGDALHFPLRIPVGPEPRRLAATPNGEYVVVLNGSGETVRLVDAQALTPAVDANRRAVVAAVGPAGSVPADMVVAPATAAEPNGVGCSGDGCVGRFYVSLSGAGVVMAIEVHQAPDPTDASVQVPSLVLARAYQVGGTPVSLAIHPGGHILFATDASANSVARIDLDRGEVLDRLPVDDAPGVAAVSADGTALVVARPRLKDLVVFTNLEAGSPSQLDVNPALVPVPQCLDSCGPDGVLTDAVCTGQHPADAEICTTGSGPVQVRDHEYEALFLGNTPSRIVALGAAPGAAEVATSVPCGDGTIEYSQALLVGLSGGDLVYVGLRRTNGPLAPELMSRDGCTAPSATVSEKTARKDIPAPSLSDILAACPPVPALARFQCATGEEGKAGAVVFPGRTTGLALQLEWEGVLLDRTTGGEFEAHTPASGSAEAPFVFYDQVNDLSTVQPGDILQIVSNPRPDSTCQAVLGTNPDCWLEWHVLGIDESAGTPRLLLERRDRDMPLGCYAADGTIAYRIRAGGIEVESDGSTRTVGKYLLSQAGSRIGRVAPGDFVGLGTSIGPSMPAFFQLAQSAERPLPDDVANACSFYDATGAAVSSGPYFSRGNPVDFRLSAPLTPVATGRSFFSASVSLPGDMLLVQLPDGGPVELFVTYTAGNALLAFEPFDISRLTETGRHRVFY